MASQVRKTPAREIRRLQALQRAHALLQEEHALLKKPSGSVPHEADIFAFIDTQRTFFAVKRLCTLYGVTRAGLYAWRTRGVSARRQQDRTFTLYVQAIFAASASKDSYNIHRIDVIHS